jgi:hypothetical protein
MSSVKEPDRRVDADAETSKIGRIGLEAIDDGDVGERSQGSGRSEDLRCVRGSVLFDRQVYLRPKGQ